jgi:hypothetical protein
MRLEHAVRGLLRGIVHGINSEIAADQLVAKTVSMYQFYALARSTAASDVGNASGRTGTFSIIKAST